MNEARKGDHSSAETVPPMQHMVDSYFQAKVLPKKPVVREGWVYFACDGERVKIGFSGAPHSRVQDIQSSCSLPLTVLAVIKGTMDDEAKLHTKFSADRLHGEWFTLSPKLRRHIDRLKKAEARRTPFDGYIDWYEGRHFEHPIIEKQALYCRYDIDLLKQEPNIPFIRKIVNDSLVRLGVMMADWDRGTFDPAKYETAQRNG